jgi:prepilin peptidase CpaA
VFAIAFNSISNGWDGFLFSAIGMVVGVGLLIVPYLMGGMGAGDVKLMGAVGSFLGAKATMEAFLFMALAGGVYSLALIMIRRDIFKGFFSEKLVGISGIALFRRYAPIQSESSGKKQRLKYGVAIALGTITYLLLKSVEIKLIA